MTLNPMNDGIDHINVYSRGKTLLGRLLTNFCDSPFILLDDGKFESVEGYWYWLSCKDDRLRKLSGYQAKVVGRQAGGKDWLDSEEFKKKIELAIRAKINQNVDIRIRLAQSTLPFKHYYLYGKVNPKVVEVLECDWVLAILETIRQELKNVQ